MLQIKNTLGGGKPEGSYVWRKNEVIKTLITTLSPSNFTVKVGTNITGYSYHSITLTSNLSVNLSTTKGITKELVAQWLDGVSVKVYNTNVSNYSESRTLSDNGDGTLTLTNSYGASAIITITLVNADVATITLSTDQSESASYTYVTFYGSSRSSFPYSTSTSKNVKVYDTSYSFLNYIVSDKETAYPDGGVHADGYYYVKSGMLVTTGTFSTGGAAPSSVILDIGITDIKGLVVFDSSSNTTSEAHYFPEKNIAKFRRGNSSWGTLTVTQDGTYVTLSGSNGNWYNSPGYFWYAFGY